MSETPIIPVPQETPKTDAAVSDPPTPNPAPENPSGANVEPKAETPEVPDPELLRSERVARALATATKKERQAIEKERKAAERVREAEAKLIEYNSLLSDASKDPSKAMLLLQKAGIPNLDSLARLVLQLDPSTPNPQDIANQALSEAKQLREQLDKEKAEIAATRKQREFEEVYNTHLKQVSDLVGKSPDAFELLLDSKAESEVLNRAYSFIRENNVTSLTPEEETLVLQHFATEIEDELSNQAKTLLGRLNKLKKLSISQHNIADEKQPHTSEASQITKSDNSLNSAIDAVLQPKKSSKFITNENTVSSVPLPKLYTNKRKVEDAESTKLAIEALDKLGYR